MKYVVEAIKSKSKEERYEVYSADLNINEDWVFQVYLLDLEPTSDGDVILPFMDFLKEKYESVDFSRGSIVDSQRNCFTGLSTIHVSFGDKDEALDYADMLNRSTKK